MRWLLPKALAQEDAAQGLATSLGVHPLVAQVLVHRGLTTPEAAAAFLADKLSDLPDPFTLKGIGPAVERLTRAIAQREKITLYGDYDVDGVCSTALLSLFLESLGAQVATYIPHRLDEGYGLNGAAIDRIATDGTRVLVTLDCGITSVAEVARANAHGLEVIIVDHHTVPEVLPPALAILNPHQPGCGYPTKHLCAAGVAFNLCMALRKELRGQGFFQSAPEPNLRELLDLVALATIADVVPLTGANRVLVRHGLDELSTAKRPGVRALKEIAGLSPTGPVGCGQVGFRLGPRINAAGRLDDASVGLRLLRSRSLEEALPLAKALDEANAERQAIEQRILMEALAQAEERKSARGLVLHSEGWHAGVVGIVASRVVEKFHRPVVVIAMKDGVGKGSARSIEAFHLYDALATCASHLDRFGGHKHAAGVTVSADKLAAFCRAFEEVAAERLKDEVLEARCRVDAVVPLSALTPEAVTALERLAPFGNGNPEPVFATRRLSVEPRVLVNKKGDGAVGHLKLRLEAAPHLDAIGFGMADKAGLAEGPVDLAYQVAFDEWNGVRKLQLKLKDLRLAD